MIPDRDIWRAALAMVRRYGADAVGEVAYAGRGHIRRPPLTKLGISVHDHMIIGRKSTPLCAAWAISEV